MIGVLCGLSKLRRKKIPNFLLMVCIMITTMFLLISGFLLTELDVIFDESYDAMEGPQICALWSNEIISVEAVEEYLDDGQNPMDYLISTDTRTVNYIEKNEVKLSNGILVELPEDISQNMISPKIMGFSEIEMPKGNEVWITTKLSNILQLEMGDILSLQIGNSLVDVEVVKIVVDPVFGSSSTNVYRMWCGHDTLEEFPLADNNAISYLEVYFPEYNHSIEQEFIRTAEEYFAMPLGDTLYTYDKIKGGYISTFRMIGAIISFVSVILAIMLFVLTIFLVRSDIDEDIRSIGIYKTLGMSRAQINNAYAICYGSISFVGAILGITLGGVLCKKILGSLFESIGVYTVSIPNMVNHQIFMLCFMIVSIVVVCYLVGYRVNHFNVSSAIRQGIWKDEKKKRISDKKNRYYNGESSFQLYYSVQGMRNKKIRYGYIAGMSLVIGCIITICIGCLNAIGNIDEEPELWGFIRTDIYITSIGNTQVSRIMNELQEDTRIAYGYGVNKVYAKYKPENKEDYQSIVTELYELPWNENIKDRSLYGRMPQEENEIGVGVTFAEKNNLDIGDEIELHVNGVKDLYEITGIFQTLSNYGNVIRMVTSDLDEFLKTSGVYADYMLVVHDEVDKWELADELNQKYKERFTFIASKSNGENITGVLTPAVGTIIFVAIFITVIISVNLTFILVRREQKLIGLLKAIGMTTWQILSIYLWRNLLSSSLGNTLGLLVGTYVIPSLLSPYAKNLGLTTFPFTSSPVLIGVTLLLLPTTMCVATCLIVKSINKLSVKQLLE